MPRQKEFDNQAVLDAIKSHITEKGIPPTVAEIKSAVGIGSSRTVLRYLRALEDEGLIRRWHGSRGIQVVGWGPETKPSDGLFVRMKMGSQEVWVPCYLDGGSAIIFDQQRFEKEK